MHKIYAPWLRKAIRNDKHGISKRHFYAMKWFKTGEGNYRALVYRFPTMHERDEWCRLANATLVSAIEAKRCIFKRGTEWTVGEIAIDA